jgi:hypothetical protein
VKKPFAVIVSAAVLFCAPNFLRAAPLASSDPAVVAATREMLATMKAKETMAIVLAQMEQQMSATETMAAASRIAAKDLTPERKAEEITRAKARIATVTAKNHAVFADPSLIDGLIEELVPLYAETYTLDEIRQLTAFYASPLGQKMQASAPALLKRSAEISRWFVHTRMPVKAVEGE